MSDKMDRKKSAIRFAVKAKRGIATAAVDLEQGRDVGAGRLRRKRAAPKALVMNLLSKAS